MAGDDSTERLGRQGNDGDAKTHRTRPKFKSTFNRPDVPNYTDAELKRRTDAIVQAALIERSLVS
jgi:hypothetical protein